jgi:aspartate aminotransferase
MATHLLEEYGIGLVPGSAFHAPGFMRMSFAASDQQLTQGIEKLRRFVFRYSLAEE